MTVVLLMAGEEKSLTRQESSPKKPSVWVFDENSGWIDVAAYLDKLSKLRENFNKKHKES